MLKKSFISINHSLNISEETTFDMFKQSNLYGGQIDNRFFWLTDLCEIDNISGKFKIGLCFRNNKIVRVELFCEDEKLCDESDRSKREKMIINLLKENYSLQYKSIENSFDKRNNYSSIIISF